MAAFENGHFASGGSHGGAPDGLGDVLTRLGFLMEAEAACRRAVALQDGYAAAHHNLGSALLQAGKLAEAEAAYQRALALDPRLAEAHGNMGVLLLIQERPEDAVDELRKSLAIKPGDADTYNNLGNSLKDMGRLTEALAAYRQAMALEPADASLSRSNLPSTRCSFIRIMTTRRFCARAGNGINGMACRCEILWARMKTTASPRGGCGSDMCRRIFGPMWRAFSFSRCWRRTTGKNLPFIAIPARACLMT